MAQDPQSPRGPQVEQTSKKNDGKPDEKDLQGLDLGASKNADLHIASTTPAAMASLTGLVDDPVDVSDLPPRDKGEMAEGAAPVPVAGMAAPAIETSNFEPSEVLSPQTSAPQTLSATEVSASIDTIAAAPSTLPTEGTDLPNTQSIAQPFTAPGETSFAADAVDVEGNDVDPATRNLEPVEFSVASGGSVDENAPGGTVVAVLSARDPEGAPVSFMLTDEAGNVVADPRFEIVGDEIRLRDGADIDFETISEFDLFVVASDGQGITDPQPVRIAVIDINEGPSLTQATGNVAENEAGASLLNVGADDPDAGDHLTFDVDDARFEVVDGYLQLRPGESLDHETAESVTVQVTATDSEGFSATESYVITVEDVNEGPVLSALDGTVAENADGAAVGAVSVSDPDAGDTVSFSVDDARFEVVGGQLRLRSGEMLDHEIEPSVSVTITVTDSQGVTDSQVVTVTVADVNDGGAGEIGDSDANANRVAENAAPGTIVGVTAIASDPDTADSISYSLSDDADGRFSIDPVSGVVRVAGPLDFEAASNHVIEVTASSTDGSSTTQSFTISVSDVDEAPVLVGDDTVTADENQTSVTTLVADTDAGETLSYAIVGGADAGLFSIDPTTGALSFVSTPDYETPGDADGDNAYEVVVEASDGGQSDTQTVSVTVADVNEAPTLATTNVTATENDDGAVIGAVSATDPDAGDAVTVSVDDARFEVVGGQLRLRSGETLDYETDGPSVNVTVTATDSHGATDSQVVTVTVADEAEAITLGDGGASFADTGVAETSIAGGTGDDTITAHDDGAVIDGGRGADNLTGGTSADVLDGGDGSDVLDGGVGADTLTGGEGQDTLTGGNGSDNLSGGEGDDVISAGSGTDRVFGGLGNDTMSGAGGFDLLDGGEGADEISGGSGSDTLTGGAGDDVLDGGQDTDIAVFSGAWADYTITESGGVYTVVDNRPGSPDGTDTITNVEVFRFSDGDISPADALNDGPNLTADDGTVSENAVGALVGAVGATDPDAGDTVTLSVDDARFKIVGGQLKLKEGESLDYEVDGDTVSVTVTATDVHGATDTQVVTVTVGDVAEAITLGNTGEDFTDTGVAETIVYGGTGDDALSGHESGANIEGRSGNDTISGGSGDDTLLGGADEDVLDGGDGSDTLTGGSGFDTITGGNGNDSINGGSDNDLLTGGDGDDTISGGTGDDVIYFGDGANTVYGGDGNDVIDDENGNPSTTGGDYVAAGAGNDMVWSGDANDTIHGGDGNDYLNGQNDNDSVTGGDGNDTLVGEFGDDTLEANAGDDSLEGGNGADLLTGGAGDDRLDGGTDTDVAVFSGAWADYTITESGGVYTVVDNRSGSPDGTDTITNVEGFRFSDGDVSPADALNDGPTLSATDGTVTENDDGAVVGAVSAKDPDAGDTVSVSVDDARFEVVGGQLRLRSGETLDYESDGPSVNVTVTATDSHGATDSQVVAVTVADEAEAITLGDGGVSFIDTGVGEASITGGSDGDKIIGHDDGAVIDGGEGDDEVQGGAGADVLDGGQGADTVEGGADNDLINGGNGADVLDGEGGSDTIDGGADNDSLTGGSGDDSLAGGSGDDTISAGSDRDTLEGGEGDDSLSGGFGDDTLRGDEGADTLDGGYGDDLLTGGAGNDTLDGGSNTDTAVFTGDWADYSITESGGVYTVTDNRPGSPDGSDSVTNVEVFRFADGDVSVADALNDAPVLSTTDGTVSENEAGAVVGAVSATDPDAADTVTFSVDDARFEVVAGQLRLRSGESLDYETDDSSVGVTVTATDAHGAVDTQLVTVSVTDLAEAITLGDGGVAFADTGVAETSITGGTGDDTITGHDDGAVIDGGDGDDSIVGGSGNDTLDGSYGEDTLFGGDGDDALLASYDNGAGDRFDGGDGNDTYVIDGTEVDHLAFDIDLQSGSDNFGNTYTSIENVTGGSNADQLVGDGADNVLRGMEGDDTLQGDSSANLVVNGSFEDIDGAKTDSVRAVMTTVEGWTDANGNSFEMHVDGYSSTNATDGGYWLDMAENNAQMDISQTISAMETGDSYTLTFDAGNYSSGLHGEMEVYFGGELIATIDPTVQDQMDTYTFELLGGSGDGSNSLRFVEVGSSGNVGVALDNVQIVASGDDTLDGGSGNDLLEGGGGNDVIFGGDGSDTLVGGAGNDSLEGGDGSDLLHGGTGDDTIVGGADGSPSFSWIEVLNGDSFHGTSGTDYYSYDASEGSNATIRFNDTPYDAGASDGVTDYVRIETTANAELTIGDFDLSEDRIILQEDYTNISGHMTSDYVYVTVDYAGGTSQTFTIWHSGGSFDAASVFTTEEPTIPNTSADVAVYDGNFDDFDVTYDAGTGTFTITDLNAADGDEGTDTVTGVETFRFNGTDYTAAEMIDEADRQANTEPDSPGVASGGSVAENAASGTVVAVLSATDADGDTLTYQITDASGAPVTDSNFEIVGDEIRIRSGADLDYETATSHDLYVTASDDNATSTPQSITLTVSDEAESITLVAGGVAFTDMGMAETLISGGTGDDTITGHEDGAMIDGEDGADQIAGGIGDDHLSGGRGDDLIEGGDGDDFLDGDQGQDTLIGGAGNDTFEAHWESDTVDGGDGIDSIYWYGSISNYDISYDSATDTFTIHDIANNHTDTVTNVEVFTFGGVDYTEAELIALTGDPNDNADNSDNTAAGGGATHSGTSGADAIWAGGDADQIYGLDGNDSLGGGAGNDLVYGDAGDDQMYGNDGEDTLYGGSGNDVIVGHDGNDVIAGDGGSDTLYGDAGTDQLSGGSGADVIYGGSEEDTIYGDEGADSLYGEAGNDVLYGGSGNDTVHGGDDNDTLYGGLGNDSLVGDAGDDAFFISAMQGDDTINGGTIGGWTDSIVLEGMGSGVSISGNMIDGDGWTMVLDSGFSVTGQSSDTLDLTAEASGTITFDNGGVVDFIGIERVEF